MRTMQFFWQYFKKYKLSFIIVILMMVVSTVLQVLFPIYVGQAVQHLVELGAAFSHGEETSLLLTTFGAIMGNLFLIFLCLSVSSLIYMVLMTRVISHSTNEMRKVLFGKLAKLTVAFFDRHQDGDILSRFTSDLDNILQALNESMIQVLSNVLLYICLVIIMFVQHAKLAWITVASTPVAFLILIAIVRLARKYTNLQQKEVGQLNAFMDEVISGQKAIIVQGMQEEVIHSFVAQNDRVRSATFKGRAFSGLLFPIMNGMSLINTAIVIFAGSAILLNDSNIEAAVAIGLITTYAQFSQQYYQPIIQLAASLGSLPLAFTGADRFQ